VYEQRRLESLKIMDETDLKRQKIEEFLEYIESRLEELDDEKEELAQFQEMDKDRRCLEYTIYSREQNELNDQLNSVEDQRQIDLEDSKQRLSGQETQLATLHGFERDLEEALISHASAKDARKYMADERKDLVMKKTQLELMIVDLDESAAQNRDTISAATAELGKYDSQIETKSQELQQIIPRYEGLIRDESIVKAKLVK
jgi:structural maintenance of chromosome 3 (chondroitin sulfate proteoglycan 6)